MMMTRRRRKAACAESGSPVTNETQEIKSKKAREESAVERTSDSSPISDASDLMERMSLSNESVRSKPTSPPPELEFQGHEPTTPHIPQPNHQFIHQVINFHDIDIDQFLHGSELNFLDNIESSAELAAPVLSPVVDPINVSPNSSRCITPPPRLDSPNIKAEEVFETPEKINITEVTTKVSNESPLSSSSSHNDQSPPPLLPYALTYAASSKNPTSSSDDDDHNPKSFEKTSKTSWKALKDLGKTVAKTLTSKLSTTSDPLTPPQPISIKISKKKGRKPKTFRGRNAKLKEESRKKDVEIENEEKKVRQGYMPMLEYHGRSMRRKCFMLGLTPSDVNDIRLTIIDLMQKVVDLPPIQVKKQRARKVVDTTRDFFLRSRPGRNNLSDMTQKEIEETTTEQSIKKEDC